MTWAVPLILPLSTRHHDVQQDGVQLECLWKDCKRPRPFVSKLTLMRHVRSQHIYPRSVNCLNKDCDQVFRRKSDMKLHLRRVHKVTVWELSSLALHVSRLLSFSFSHSKYPSGTSIKQLNFVSFAIWTCYFWKVWNRKLSNSQLVLHMPYAPCKLINSVLIG